MMLYLVEKPRFTKTTTIDLGCTVHYRANFTVQSVGDRSSFRVELGDLDLPDVSADIYTLTKVCTKLYQLG